MCPQNADKVVKVEKCTSSVQRRVVRCARTLRRVIEWIGRFWIGFDMWISFHLSATETSALCSVNNQDAVPRGLTTRAAYIGVFDTHQNKYRWDEYHMWIYTALQRTQIVIGSATYYQYVKTFYRSDYQMSPYSCLVGHWESHGGAASPWRSEHTPICVILIIKGMEPKTNFKQWAEAIYCVCLPKLCCIYLIKNI